MNMAAMKLSTTTVVVLTILVGVVSGQMCPQLTNCFNNLGVDMDSALSSLQPEGVINITYVSEEVFGVVCQHGNPPIRCYYCTDDFFGPDVVIKHCRKTSPVGALDPPLKGNTLIKYSAHQAMRLLLTCYDLLPQCPDVNMYASLLPSSKEISQYLNLLCQNKAVFLRGTTCMSSGTVNEDAQTCVTQVQRSMSGMTQLANIQQVLCGAYDSIISCLTKMPSFQTCGSDFSTLMTKAIGYLKPASCTSGGRRVTGSLVLGIVMAFLISRISKWF